MYQVEVVWNREFRFVPFGKEHETIEAAKKYAVDIIDSGDGARVKKAQVIDLETGEVAVESYKIRD